MPSPERRERRDQFEVEEFGSRESIKSVSGCPVSGRVQGRKATCWLHQKKKCHPQRAAFCTCHSIVKTCNFYPLPGLTES